MATAATMKTGDERHCCSQAGAEGVAVMMIEEKIKREAYPWYCILSASRVAAEQYPNPMQTQGTMIILRSSKLLHVSSLIPLALECAVLCTVSSS